MDRLRPPAVAGSFYPSDSRKLNELLDDCFFSNPLGPQGIKSAAGIFAGLVPHAGFVYSGPCAAHLYASLDPSIRRIIMIGVNHRARGARAALSRCEYWETPFGNVPVDQDANDFLQTRVDFLQRDDVAHEREHSIEVQLPFLQRRLEDFAFVPISLSDLSLQECEKIGAAVAELYESETSRQRKTAILASTDLNHYLSPREIDELDRTALEPVLGLDPAGLMNIVEKESLTMCGFIPTAVMLMAANALGAKRAQLLKHCHSGDVSRMDEVVGYASVALER